MNQETWGQKMGQIWTRCWTDAAFKAQLMTDPHGVLKAEGLDMPADLQIVVLENSPTQVHWVIPARPSQLSDADLEGVAAGADGLLDFLASGRLPIAWSIARKPAPALFDRL